MGNFDIFLVKFNNNGVWIWATYYGGSGGGGASRWATIALDGSNNLFVTGRTNCTNFPVLNLAGAYFQPAISGIQDAFILKFNNNGILLWATYYGGSGDDQGYSIAIDASDDVLVTGSTSSVNFPVLNLAAAYNQPGSAGVQDAFILKFNNNGLRLWSTYYGGSGDDLSYSIAIDNANNILITGSATSVNLPVLNLAGAYNQPGNAGGQDAFVAKFNGSGVQLWATYYGGSGTDQGCSVAIDAADNVFVVGNTSSANLPLLNLSGAYNQPGFAGVQDVFILKFNSSGVRLWATYFGGNSIDFFRNYTDHEITIDVCGNLYITGGTNSTDFPVLNPGCGSHFQGTYAGGNPYGIFFLKFSNNGILLWSTHSGASALGFGSALAIDISGNLFAVGEWFYSGSNGLIDPGGGAYFDATFNTSDDSYMMKFIPLVSAQTQGQTNSTACSPCNGSATISLTCSEPTYSYTWSNGSSTLNSVSGTNTITGLCPGTYTVTATSNCNQTQSATFIITGPSCGVTVTAVSAAMCQGLGPCPTISASGSSGTSPYTYSWSTGNTTQSINPCPASTTTYTVQVTDSGGATSTTTATVTVNATVSVTVSSTNLSCNGSTNGTATANPGSGTSPFTYNWSNAGATQTITGLTQGNYTVTVTDNKGCTFSTSVALISPAPLAGQFSKGTANCTACGCKEWLMVVATGGTSPYAYSWPDGYTNRYKNKICPGSYTVNIKDKNGCSLIISLTTP